MIQVRCVLRHSTAAWAIATARVTESICLQNDDERPASAFELFFALVGLISSADKRGHHTSNLRLQKCATGITGQLEGSNSTT